MTFITSKLKDLNENRQQNSISSDNHSETFNSSSPLVTRFRFEVNEVIQHIRSKIWGQDEVLEGIEEMLNIIWTDITEENRPLYVALLLGPTGVGKTKSFAYLVKLFTEMRRLFAVLT